MKTMNLSRLALAAASLGLWAGCGVFGDDRACTLVGCADEAAFERAFTTVSDSGEGLLLTACRNQSCQQAGVTLVGTDWRCAFPPQARMRCSLARTGANAWTVMVNWELGGSEAPADGDRYRLAVEEAGAVRLDETVTAIYTETTPNGPECGPVCRSARL